MPMTMAISWAGKPNRDKGLSRRSNAFVTSSVMVVMVTRVMASIMVSTRAATSRHWYTPASLTRTNPHSKSTVPPCTTNRLSTAATTAMTASGATERAALPSGRRATTKNASTKRTHTPRAAKSRAMSAMTMNAHPSSSLARGSMRCSGLSPGR